MKGLMVLLGVSFGLGLIPARAAVSPSNESSAVESILNEDMIRGLRDPFQPPAAVRAKKKVILTELEMFQLKDFKLNGVITGPKKVRAMITTPANKTYFVKVGDRLGAREGRVTHILGDAIRVEESIMNEKGKPIPDVYEIRMTGELVSMSKKGEE
jgi:hypothetical protein